MWGVVVCVGGAWVGVRMLVAMDAGEEVMLVMRWRGGVGDVGRWW